MYVEGIASGGGSDWFYIAVIHAPNGAAVHVDDGDEDIDATVASGDYIGIPVHNQNSTYTITVTMNGLAAPDQTFTTGSTSGQMIEKTFEFAEIDITYDDEFRGQTATITDGTHTATVTVPAVGNNLVLHVPYTGNWHISAVDPVSGDTFYTSPDPIAITSLSQTVSCHLFVIPDGKTVTPTDDIQTWLACGNIKGKSYTTLAEVLADEDTLRKLLTDDNAIDYLKRSTTWAVASGSGTDIQSSELAMSYIGAYDYAAETLLGDSTWNTAILGSTYASYVVNASVPTMTDNTHPSGEAISSPIHQSYYAYYAFDKNNSTFFGKQQNYANPYVGYEFVNSVIINKVYIRNSEHSANVSPNLALKGSPDGTNWTLITNLTLTNVGANAENTFEFVNADAYKYIAIFSLDTLQYWNVAELQFYGREAAGVQTWLKAAGLDRPYTTLAEVLADHNALAALMSSHDAVDYLVTVKSWIDAITADETAMRYIGRRNYAADTLLADEDWCAGIASSTYSRYVLNVSVPIMTSNTTPEGLAFSNTPYSSTYAAWKAFNGNSDDEWMSDAYSTLIYLGYKFTSAKKVSLFRYMENGYSYRPKHIKLQGSNDTTTGADGNWTDITSSIDVSGTDPANTILTIPVSNNNSYLAYRLWMDINTWGSNVAACAYLDFLGREDVDETTIDIFSAASDTVYYIDPTLGSQVTVATTDTSGKATIQKSNLPDGEYTLYSTVAKDPNNLSDPYHKRVSVDSDTMDIMVMPDDAIYWYGFDTGELEHVSSGNGWTTSISAASVQDTTTDGTNYFNKPTTSQGIGGRGTKLKKSADKFCGIFDALQLYSGNAGNIAVTPNKILGGPSSQLLSYDSLSQLGLKRLMADMRNLDDEYYLSAFSYHTSAFNCYALWTVRHNPAANFFGAANDTVYYMSGGVQVVFAETNELGEAVVDYSKLTPGSYTLISSVAKDPDNLSNPYSKVVTVDGNPIYFMPDNALYWYGYMSPNCEIMSAVNGWSGRTFVDPTLNDKYVHLDSTNNSSGIGSKNSIPTSTIHIIAKGINIVGASYGLFGVGVSGAKDVTTTGTTTTITSNADSHVTHTMASSGYIYAMAVSGRIFDVNALWYE